MISLLSKDLGTWFVFSNGARLLPSAARKWPFWGSSQACWSNAKSSLISCDTTWCRLFWMWDTSSHSPPHPILLQIKTLLCKQRSTLLIRVGKQFPHHHVIYINFIKSSHFELKNSPAEFPFSNGRLRFLLRKRHGFWWSSWCQLHQHCCARDRWGQDCIRLSLTKDLWKFTGIPRRWFFSHFFRDDAVKNQVSQVSKTLVDMILIES